MKSFSPSYSKETLKQQALAIRKNFLRMHFENKAGHIGTGLSAIDLLAYLYGFAMRPAPARDHFILSKGHGASALYATLHHHGKLSDADLKTYYKDGTLLPAHPAPKAWEAIPAATGSLGHGLPIATGMAYAEKNFHKSDARVFALLSDGECNEGSTWEAALFGAHHKLGNLTVIVDANGLQGFGRTEDVMNLEPFAKKWEAFGFQVIEIDGHDFDQIHAAISTPTNDRPKCVVARTVKGKGVQLMENKMEWHYLPMAEEHYRQALLDLEVMT
jgi:transketolase